MNGHKSVSSGSAWHSIGTPGPRHSSPPALPEPHPLAARVHDLCYLFLHTAQD